METTRSNDGLPQGRVGGIIIAACTALSLLAIAHHPTLQISKIETGIEQVVRLASLDRLVHGVMIAITLALDFGYAIFSFRCGIHRQSVLVGLIAYAVGSAAIISAALIDGFVLPAIAEQYVSLPRAASAAATLFSFCAIEIETFTRFGLIATSVAILAWSAPLLRRSGSLQLAAVTGVVSALASVALLTMMRAPLNPQTLLLLLGAQSIWNLAVANVLLRRSL